MCCRSRDWKSGNKEDSVVVLLSTSNVLKFCCPFASTDMKVLQQRLVLTVFHYVFRFGRAYDRIPAVMRDGRSGLKFDL